MKKMYKMLLLALCAALLVVGSVMGTLAYLQMQTQTVTNTFTVGKVSITLQETYKDADGVSKTNTTGYDNFKLIPGTTIQKKPFITVTAGSEECYLFVEVDSTLGELITYNGAENWEKIDKLWVYKNKVTTSSQDQVIDIFTSVTCANVEKYTIDSGSIKITAYAVQAEGFDNAQSAWNNTFGAVNP